MNGSNILFKNSKTCVIAIHYYNTDDTINCLESLNKSPCLINVIVVDNSPNDPALAAISAAYSEVAFLRAPENLGFGRGNNYGIRWAMENTECEYFFILNNDAMVTPETIMILEQAMIDFPEVGIVTPRITYAEQPEILWYGGGEVDWRRGSAVVPGINKAADAKLAMMERNVTFASGCALFVRRSVFKKIGGFDPRIFMYEEDVELCLRASKNRVLIRYIPQALVFHKCQGSIKETKSIESYWDVGNPKLPFYAFHIIRNRLLNMYDYARGINAIIFLLFFPLFLLRRVIPFLIGGRVDAVFAMINGAVSFIKIRRDCFTNELS